MMYSLDEVSIIPSVTTTITSRKEVNPYYSVTKNKRFSHYKHAQTPKNVTYTEDKLPVFVAPMTCLLDKDNFDVFNNKEIIPILPVFYKMTMEERIEYLNNDKWIALSLADFESVFCTECKYSIENINPIYVCIDTANGHLKDINVVTAYAKRRFPNLHIMIGNIANPETALYYNNEVVDYIRVGIGGGSGCTTSVQTGIHASLPYLLSEINKYKKDTLPKIVADGGINTISKAIKCLALGADYVMMGYIFASCKEVRSYTPDTNHYYGQSSEQGQIDRFGKVKSNPEGLGVVVPRDFNLVVFCDKFAAALRSAMSYCNAKTLEEFIGKPKIEYQTLKEFENYMK